MVRVNREVVNQNRIPAVMTISAADLMLIAVLLVPAGCAVGQSAAPPTSYLRFIVRSMEKAQSRIQLPRRVTREYCLGSPARAAESDVIAEIDLTPPGKYAIQKTSGSNRAEQVVKRILEKEVDTAGSVEKSRSTAVTSENYDFSYLGKALLNGRPYFLLQMTPKREQSELISGRAWIDQHSFLIRRIEGELAKSPSWWVKSVHIDLGFSSYKTTWLQTSMEALAEVRLVGAQKLTAKVLEYDTFPLAATMSGPLKASSFKSGGN
jgi:hypothetical protein